MAEKMKVLIDKGIPLAIKIDSYARENGHYLDERWLTQVIHIYKQFDNVMEQSFGTEVDVSVNDDFVELSTVVDILDVYGTGVEILRDVFSLINEFHAEVLEDQAIMISVKINCEWKAV